ncbi:hypothetical protein WJS89_07330 [Sphingomicrobium sp. XHP0235]|uniref:hypothetical protein n=1 Tax=Sphingomicrobium aquimarinum TaxID=3133971 RepID=UPI0031FE946C
MDLNELLHSQQIALMKADLADDGAERSAHLDTVADCAERIATLRHAKSAPRYPEAGSADDTGDAAIAAIADRSALPPIVTHEILEYRVGPYRYTDLALALAQQARAANDPAAQGANED